MALENGLYALVVMIRIRELDDIKEKDKTKIYNFQGQSAMTKHWFDLDHEWLKENIMTREPDFYLKNIKINLGVIQHRTIKSFDYQLVMQK